MKTRNLSLALLVFAALLGMGFTAGNAFCADNGPIIQDVGGKGKIDWSQGWIEAVGTGAPPEKYYGKPQARPMALRAAQLDAFRNLLEVVKGVQLTSNTTIEDFVTTSDVIKTQVSGMVNGAQTMKREYLSDGTVEVTVRMSLYGNFTQLLLPVEARPAPTPVEPPPAVAPSAPAAPSAPVPAAPAVRIYTGLVVDARGLSARPAMSPKVLDEDGVEVYGTASVSREYAVQQGMAGYSKDANSAQTNPRVTNTPVTVKGIRTQGPGRSDIVISRADAAALRAAGQDLTFLQKCRVMIVLD